MKVLILSAWEDTGGVGIALTRALRKYTSWEARFVHRHHNYIEYPTDIYWEPGTPLTDELRTLFAEADVIHVMERWSAVMPFQDWRDKPLVMHHHGTEFRVDNTANLIATTKEYRAVGIVSTLDLTLIDPDVEWLPNPCDAMMMRRIRAEHRPDGDRIRIAHSPTNRALKATDLFLEAAAGLPIEVDLIEWLPWQQCLERKAAADVFYDQLHIGYALSGIEAMAMGIPVIGGAADARIVPLMLAVFGYVPFYIASEASLRARIEQLTSDSGLRAAFSELGMRHVEAWHSEHRVAEQLAGIYGRAMALR